MESFSADWLALREPADHVARADVLTDTLAAHLPRDARVSAVDLAAGTGSNVRYLLPRLPQVAHWTLVDHDAALLEAAMHSLGPVAAAAGVTIDTRVADLRDLDALPLHQCALVTASALLDLVSAAWLEALATRVRAAGGRVLFTLSYDGRLSCWPEDPWDARVRDLVNAHQRTDKGFGPALGPDATDAALEAFGAGPARATSRTTPEVVSVSPRVVRTASSDWVLTAEDPELQRQLVDGWTRAAHALAPGDAVAIANWCARRHSAIAGGTSVIRVGHQDLLAL